MTLEITFGMILTFLGLVGTIACLITLVVTNPIFKKQRKNLLNEIESE